MRRSSLQEWAKDGFRFGSRGPSPNVAGMNWRGLSLASQQPVGGGNFRPARAPSPAMQRAKGDDDRESSNEGRASEQSQVHKCLDHVN